MTCNRNLVPSLMVSLAICLAATLCLAQGLDTSTNNQNINPTFGQDGTQNLTPSSPYTSTLDSPAQDPTTGVIGMPARNAARARTTNSSTNGTMNNGTSGAAVNPSNTMNGSVGGSGMSNTMGNSPATGSMGPGVAAPAH